MSNTILPDHGLSDKEMLDLALAESYASASQDTILLYGIEIDHKAFSQPARVIRWSASTSTPKEFQCKLEDDAPKNAGETVTFIGCPFEITFPDKTEENVGQFTFKVPGVAWLIQDELEAAALSGGKISAIVRVYVKGEEDKGPAQVWPGINMESPSIDANTGDITIVGNLFGWLTRTFGKNFTPSRYPALVT